MRDPVSNTLRAIWEESVGDFVTDRVFDSVSRAIGIEFNHGPAAACRYRASFRNALSGQHLYARKISKPKGVERRPRPARFDGLKDKSSSRLCDDMERISLFSKRKDGRMRPPLIGIRQASPFNSG
jgi:hypothetical protein